MRFFTSKKYTIIIATTFLVICFCGLSAFIKNYNNYNENDWNLVWIEDFNGTELDTNTWNYMERRKEDGSRRWHSSDFNCYEYKNGKLVIRGLINPNPQNDTARYITGAITTEGKKSFGNGRLEICARLNSAKGAWPAFWLLPFQFEKGWPEDGEIDIMEHLNYDNYVYQTVHSSFTKANPNAKRGQSTKINKDRFNLYSVDLLEDSIIFYVNKKKTMSYFRDTTLYDMGQFPFNREWYLMLDMQLGGSWVGSIDDSTLPVEMEIDWVKFYKHQ